MSEQEATDLGKPDNAEEGPSAAEEADALLDKAIETAFGDPDDDDESDLHAAAAAKPKKAKEPEAEEEPESEEDGDADAPELEDLPGDDDDLEDAADDGARAKADEADELDDAYATLLGLPKAHRPLMSDLKNMPRAKLIAWAKRVEEASEANEGTSSAEHGRDRPASAKESGAPAQAAAEQLWATTRATIAEKLGIDEEAADALKPLHDTNESLRAELKALHDKIDQQEQSAREREGRATINSEVQRLTRRHPELKSDADRLAKVKEAAMDIAAGLQSRGKPVDARSVFDRAAREVLGAPKRADLAQLRRNGTSQPPERVGNDGGSGEMNETAYWLKAADGAVAGKGSGWVAKLRPPAQAIQKQRRRW